MTRARALAALATAAIACGSEQAGGASTTGPQRERADACAGRVLAAIEARSGEALAAAAHRVRGIRFTPFGFLSDGDVALDVRALRDAFTDRTTRDWANLGESDERIRMTTADYLARFVHDPAARAWEPAAGDGPASYEGATFHVDLLQAELAKAYPNGHVVELRRPPSVPHESSADWAVLRVVCEEHEGRSQAVAIVHVEWTP